VQASRIRPETGPIDRRRLAAAGLSAVLPGLGQLFNRRSRLAALFLGPSLIVLVVFGLLWATQSPVQLAARAAAPTVLGALLTLNLVLLVWRLLAVGQGFLDTRWHGPTGRTGMVGIVVIALLVVVPHLLVYSYGTAFGRTFAEVFVPGNLGSGGEPGASPTPARGLDERVNVLLLGVDSLPWRTATLTDTMMIVSLDPVAKSVSMLSVPRDLINVPLGDGNVFGPKINSLMSYADRHPDEFPAGGVTTLRNALGALLGIDIHYYARMEFPGFIEMVDAVGGVDVQVVEGFNDPTYDGYMLGQRGWSIEAGPRHLDGNNALAYARARKANGESDFTRAGRQQQILVALRNAVTKDGGLLWKLPDLLKAVGKTIKTDVPVELLPQLAAVVDEVTNANITRVVIRHPLVRSEQTRYGSSLNPDVEAIRAVAAALFPEPGGDPQPWPTPKPTATPRPSASP
jgi:LCP family protein required for cell wall assembly